MGEARHREEGRPQVAYTMVHEVEPRYSYTFYLGGTMVVPWINRSWECEWFLGALGQVLYYAKDFLRLTNE